VQYGPRRLLVFGASGMVGSALLARLTSEPDIAGIVAPTRRQVPELMGRSGVSAPLVDFDDLPGGLAGIRAEQVFVCLGTTMARAGSQAAFRRVDHGAVVAASRAALGAGAHDLFVVSSLGANPSARSFYLRVKGEAEEELRALPFRSIHVFRPSLLAGARRESRPVERLAMLMGNLVAPALAGPLRRYRPVAADTVAAAMVNTARSPAPGRWVHESDEIARIGRGA
jgi:uncharacterized protein YbjT (DUF2867 family)